MTTTRTWLLASLLLAACGSGDDDGGDDTSGAPDATRPDASAPDAAAPDAEPAAFTLTSTALIEGGMFPDQYNCDGDNVSPPLAWGAHAEAQSYALVFQDQTNELIHWVIWDISPTVRALPESVENVPLPAVPAGAKQTHSYGGVIYGYRGPCPGGDPHTYRFTLHALDVATVPDISTSSTKEDAADAIVEHSIANASLSAMSDAGG